MPLEANRIQLAAPAETRNCEMCGLWPIPERLPHVAFNNKSGDGFAPGLVHTVDEQPTLTAYRTRDTSGDTSVKVLYNPQLCADCVKRAAELLGLGDRAPLLAELDELRAQNDNLRERLEQSEHQREQAEHAFRDSARREHMLAAGLPAAKATAKRPSRAKA